MQADKLYLQAPVVKPRDKGQNPGSAALWGLLEGAWYTIEHEALGICCSTAEEPTGTQSCPGARGLHVLRTH